MRRNIFEIMDDRINLKDDINRIVNIALKEKTISVNNYIDYSLFGYIDEYCFKEWKYRNHYLDVKDLLNALDFDQLTNEAKQNQEALLTLLELVYNFWYLAEINLDKETGLYWFGNFYHLQSLMDDILIMYNYKAFTYKDKEQVLVLEDKPEVTAVAEITDPDLSYEILKYNHYTLKGEIDLKKKILLSLASEIEPKRKELNIIDKQLSDNIFYLFNNLNLRHNNRSKNSKNYKEYVSKMRKNQLEKYYDELYQMILLAILLLDNVSRMKKIKKLKYKIEETK